MSAAASLPASVPSSSSSTSSLALSTASGGNNNNINTATRCDMLNILGHATNVRPVAGFFLKKHGDDAGLKNVLLGANTGHRHHQHHNPTTKSPPHCGGVPTLSNMTDPTWLAGYDHGYADGAATATKACAVLQTSS
eukprot:PhM_4_TR5684/c0_g1_i1/m.73896